MTGTPLAVLDTCVLANFSLCDTLLRLAEPPRYFEPGWSEEIIRETTRTLELELGWPNSAVRGEAAIISTLNLRHLRPEHLAMWGVRALHPQSFLIEIFLSLRQLLDILDVTVPAFVSLVSGAISRE